MTQIDRQMGDDAHELEQQITGLKQLIVTTRTTMNNDRVFEEACASHRAAIELHQRQLAQLIDARTNGPDIIERAQDQIVALRKRINLVKNRDTVRRLIALQQQIDELQNG